MKITRIETQAVRLPRQGGKISLAHTTASAALADVVLVTIHTDGPPVGHGIVVAPSSGQLLNHLIQAEFAPLLTGEDPRRPEHLSTHVANHYRGVGFTGVLKWAYSAIDIALWDIKCQAAQMPLAMLLGAGQTETKFIVDRVADMGIDADATLKAMKPFVQQGALGCIVDVGSGNIQQDTERVQQVRDGLGEDGWVGVRCGGNYDLPTALALAHFFEDDIGIDWLEHPLPNEDVIGYKQLADRMEVPLALGANYTTANDFREVLTVGHARVLRPNLYRLGGLTPLLNVCRLATAFPVRVVPTGLAEILVHVAGSFQHIPFVEWVPSLSTLLKHPVKPHDGKLHAPTAGSLNLEFNTEAIAKLKQP